MSSVIGIIAFSILGVIALAIPVLIGVYVYRDAGRRGMNAVLWTLICILAPGFIGLIIYLVIRSDHPDTLCGNCGKPVRENFLSCPYCGAPLKERCDTCGYPLEAGWVKCPGCGSEIPPEKQNRVSVKRPKDKGLRWLLGLVIAIPAALCVLLIAGLIFLRAGYSDSMSMSTVLMTQEEFSQLGAETRDWIAACDRQGQGVYVQEAVHEADGRVRTEYLIYRNDGVYDAYTENAPGGRLKPPSVQAQFTVQEPQGATLFYLEQSARKESSLQIFTDGTPTDFRLEGAEMIRLQDAVSYLNIILEIPKDMKTVYGAGCTLYAGDEAISSQGMINADETVLTGDVCFDYEANDLVGATAFSVTLYDADEQVMEETRKFEIGGRTDFVFSVSRDEDGELHLELKNEEP